MRTFTFQNRMTLHELVLVHPQWIGDEDGPWYRVHKMQPAADGSGFDLEVMFRDGGMDRRYSVPDQEIVVYRETKA